jgi:hypothetical protein
VRLSVINNSHKRDDEGRGGRRGGGTVCAAPVAVCLCIRECPSTNIHAVYVYSHMKDGRVCMPGYRRKEGTHRRSLSITSVVDAFAEDAYSTRLLSVLCVSFSVESTICALSLSLFSISLFDRNASSSTGYHTNIVTSSRHMTTLLYCLSLSLSLDKQILILYIRRETFDQILKYSQLICRGIRDNDHLTTYTGFSIQNTTYAGRLL